MAYFNAKILFQLLQPISNLVPKLVVVSIRQCDICFNRFIKTIENKQRDEVSDHNDGDDACIQQTGLTTATIEMHD